MKKNTTTKTFFIQENILSAFVLLKVVYTLLNNTLIPQLSKLSLVQNLKSNITSRINAPANLGDKTSSYRKRYNNLIERYQRLKDDSNASDSDVEQLRMGVEELKTEVQDDIDTIYDVGDPNDDSDIGYIDNVEQPIETEIEPTQVIMKPNYGDLIAEYEMRATETWQKYFQQRCVGKTEGKANKRCRSAGVDQAMRTISNGVGKCSNTNNPNACRQSFQRLIGEWRKRKQSYLRG